jgi:tetratricopeptide (TPR) repeat protein
MRGAWGDILVCMRSLLATVLTAAMALILTALSGSARTVCAQGTYIPRPPVQDSVLIPEAIKDPRVAPRDAFNPMGTDVHVPKSERKEWVNQDYFAIGADQQATFLIPVVENAHLGPKSNPRGFWRRYNEGSIILAMGELKYVLWVFPNHPRALQLLGVLAKQAKDTTIPIAFYEKALRLFPKHAYTHAQYGAYMVDIGETTQGIMQLEEALRMDPTLLTARAWLDKAKREIGLENANLGPTPQGATPAVAPFQRDGIYVPRR